MQEPEGYDPAIVRYVYQTMRRKVLRRALIWLAVAIVAGLISLGTYADAQQQALETGSGTYYVWWGPMVLGGWKALRHFWVLGGIAKAQRKDDLT